MIMQATLTLTLAMAHATTQFNVAAGVGSLEKATTLIRNELQHRRANRTGCNNNIEVRLGSGRHYPSSPDGLQLSEHDAGISGCFKVIWSGADDGSTVIDGGLSITTPWALVDAKTNLYSTTAPAGILKPNILPVRTLYVNNVRYNRTRDSSSNVGVLGSQNSIITQNGYIVTSDKPQAWTDPTTIEMVKQHAFTQTRCPVSSITGLEPSPTPSPTPAKPGTCAWGQKLQGRSPGSEFMGLSNVTYEACQAECCKHEHTTPTACKGIIYKEAQRLCVLTDRDVLPSFEPSGVGMYVSSMNPTPVTYRTAINISQPCLSTTRSYKFGQAGYPDYFENTGNFSSPSGYGSGEFYIDRKKGMIFVTFLPDHYRPLPTQAAGATAVQVQVPPAVVVGLKETLLHVHDTHDVEWHNVSFAHSAWTQADSVGWVGNHGNVLNDWFQLASAMTLLPPLRAYPQVHRALQQPVHPSGWKFQVAWVRGSGSGGCGRAIARCRVRRVHLDAARRLVGGSRTDTYGNL
jgi:hypothetical protein